MSNIKYIKTRSDLCRVNLLKRDERDDDYDECRLEFLFKLEDGIVVDAMDYDFIKGIARGNIYYPCNYPCNENERYIMHTQRKFKGIPVEKLKHHLDSDGANLYDFCEFSVKEISEEEWKLFDKIRQRELESAKTEREEWMASIMMDDDEEKTPKVIMPRRPRER